MEIVAGLLLEKPSSTIDLPKLDQISEVACHAYLAPDARLALRYVGIHSGRQVSLHMQAAAVLAYVRRTMVIGSPHHKVTLRSLTYLVPPRQETIDVYITAAVSQRDRLSFITRST